MWYDLKKMGDFTDLHKLSRPKGRSSEKAAAHCLVAPDGVEEGGVILVADLWQDKGQQAAVAVQLGIHEVLKVEQVCHYMHGWRRREE